MKFYFELWTASTNTCNDRESLKSEFSHNSFWHVFDSWPAVTTKLLCVTCSFFRAATSDSGLANYTGSLEKTQMKQIDSADIPNTKSNTLETRFVVQPALNWLRPHGSSVPKPSSHFLKTVASSSQTFHHFCLSLPATFCSSGLKGLLQKLYPKKKIFCKAIAWKPNTILCQRMYLWASLRALLSTFGRHVGWHGMEQTQTAGARSIQRTTSHEGKWRHCRPLHTWQGLRHNGKENSFREWKGNWEDRDRFTKHVELLGEMLGKSYPSQTLLHCLSSFSIALTESEQSH